MWRSFFKNVTQKYYWKKNVFLSGKIFVGFFDGILPPFHWWVPLRQILMAFCPLLTYGAQIGRFWWYFVPVLLMWPIRHILMELCPVLTYWSHISGFWWHSPPLLTYGAHEGILSPFLLMKSIAAYFDGILPPFDLWGLLRQILMAFCSLFTYGPINADFDGIFSLLT